MAAAGHARVLEPVEENTLKMGFWSFLVVLGIAIFSIQHWIANKSYLFDAEEVARIAKKYSRPGMTGKINC